VEQIIPYNSRFKTGESVICIINSRANLTVGKEYEIMDIYGHSSTDVQEVWEKYQNEITLVIKNDNNEPTWYDHMRFVPKNEFRQHIINDILKK
jgi:hypothetical protein